MFQLNLMILRKMGWSEYREGFWRSTISFKNVNLSGSDQSIKVMYYIQPLNSEKTFIITEFLDKQKSIVEYKFIVTNHQKSEVDLTKSKEFTIINNSELIKLVRDFEACNEEYKRHFKLNRILK